MSLIKKPFAKLTTTTKKLTQTVALPYRSRKQLRKDEIKGEAQNFEML